MSKYKLQEVTRLTTASGKSYIKTRAIDFQGTFSIWQEFPNFVSLQDGSEVEGDLVKNDKGYWTLYPPKSSNSTPRSGFRPNTPKDTAKNIEAAQERKQDSIQLSSTFRDATTLTTLMTELNKVTDAQAVKSAWLNWRKWLNENYESLNGEDKTQSVPF